MLLICQHWRSMFLFQVYKSNDGGHINVTGLQSGSNHIYISATDARSSRQLLLTVTWQRFMCSIYWRICKWSRWKLQNLNTVDRRSCFPFLKWSWGQFWVCFFLLDEWTQSSCGARTEFHIFLHLMAMLLWSTCIGTEIIYMWSRFKEVKLLLHISSWASLFLGYVSCITACQ